MIWLTFKKVGLLPGGIIPSRVMARLSPPFNTKPPAQGLPATVLPQNCKGTGPVLVMVSTVLPNSNLFIVKTKSLDFSILVVKKSETLFTALYMQCTHERQPLGATTKGLYCAAHGSAFDLDGNVTIQPATAALTKFTTELNDSMLTILIPKTI